MRKGRMTQETLDRINELYNKYGCNNTVPEPVPEQVPETLNREAIGKALAAVAVAVMALADAIKGEWGA